MEDSKGLAAKFLGLSAEALKLARKGPYAVRAAVRRRLKDSDWEASSCLVPLVLVGSAVGSGELGWVESLLG